MNKESLAFKEACLTDQPLKKLLGEAGLGEQAVRDALLKYIISDRCRGCGEKLTTETFAIWTTYWNAMRVPCHADCREAGMKQEAYDCQCLDAACNDCLHFAREKMFEAPGLKGWKGRCNKFNTEVTTVPNWAELRECFEHRKSQQSQIET